MNKIKIISEKVIFNNVHSLTFVNYNNKLTEVAKMHKGFITSNSYFLDKIDEQSDTDIKIITISEWENKECWNNWFNSTDRKNISEKFKYINKEEKFDRLFKRPINNTFLL